MPLSSEQFHTLYDGAAQPVVLVRDGAVAELNCHAQELFTVGKPLHAYLTQDAALPETLYARPAVLPLLADGSEVLWLWGCGFAEGCAPDEYTHEVLTVRTEKTGEA